MNQILQLDQVVKHYDRQVAVDHVSFDMPEGCIFGLLGPNGAGKTSLIRIITTITKADSGRVFFNGQALHSDHPSEIGYMPEERGLYKKMKVGEHLLYLAQLKGLGYEEAKTEITRWLQKFSIEEWWNKKVEELSKGMQQKVQFIATVLHRPRLLILDEPFSGLDPINTNLIKSQIKELSAQGASIIFSTHRMEQVEEICEYIVLIDKGKNVLEGRVKDIRNRFKKNLFHIGFEGTLPADIHQKAEIVEQGNDDIVVQLPKEGQSNALLQYLLQSQVHLTSFQEILPSLNDIFIEQVGGQAASS